MTTIENVSPILTRALASTTNKPTNYYEYKGEKPLEFSWFTAGEERYDENCAAHWLVEDSIFSFGYLNSLSMFMKKVKRGLYSRKRSEWNDFWRTHEAAYGGYASKTSWETIDRHITKYESLLYCMPHGRGQYFELLAHVAFLKRGHQIAPENRLPVDNFTSKHTYDMVVNLNLDKTDKPKWATVECSWNTCDSATNQITKFDVDFDRLKKSPLKHGLLLTLGMKIPERHRSSTIRVREVAVQHYDFVDLLDSGVVLLSAEEYEAQFKNHHYGINHSQLVADFNKSVENWV